MEIAFKTKI